MKILFFGDSITDMGRMRTVTGTALDYGMGYVFNIAGELLSRGDYQIVNSGISGDNVVSLYRRVKPDVWVQKPDVLSILIGINDLWHDIDGANCGVEIDRFKKVYEMLIEETLQRLPKIKIILMEPFVLKGTETTALFEKFSDIRLYAQTVKELAQKYDLYFLPLQKAFDKVTEHINAANFLADGVHPNAAGAKLIADKWIELFDSKIEVAE